MRIAGVAVTQPVGGADVKFYVTFPARIANGDAGVPEIGSLVGVGIAGIVDEERVAGFGCQFPLVEIAKLPDEMQENFVGPA